MGLEEDRGVVNGGSYHPLPTAARMVTAGIALTLVWTPLVMAELAIGPGWLIVAIILAAAAMIIITAYWWLPFTGLLILPMSLWFENLGGWDHSPLIYIFGYTLVIAVPFLLLFTWIGILTFFPRGTSAAYFAIRNRPLLATTLLAPASTIALLALAVLIFS